MLSTFLRYINEKKLFLDSDKLLLTISGGKDSVVLLDLCQHAGFNVGVAHCNFQLRGEESNQDALFVEELAKKHNFPFHINYFETKTFAKNERISTQMAARNLRYAWFESIKNEFGYDYILTAHHLNDSVETVLLNLVHGTGIAGLRGILPKQNQLIRPMLCFSRKEIDDYVQENNLTWREDSSNNSDDYQRNLLRHQVIPILQSINPSLEKTFSQSAERLVLVEQFIKNQANEIKKESLTSGEILIDLQQFPENETAIVLLHEVLKGFGFSYLQNFQIWHHRDKSGKKFLTQTHELSIDRQQIILKQVSNLQEINTNYTITPEIQEIESPYFKISFSFLEPPIEFKKDKWCFDADKTVFPLTLRKWKQGDKFQPLGMSGIKKVSDFLIDRKVSLALKNNVFVLCDAQKEIMAVLGYAISEKYKITEETERVFKVSVITA